LLGWIVESPSFVAAFFSFVPDSAILMRN